ncbi:MAG: V-type ATPase 116kDa subunit family protein [Candidatus Caldarchaeum sp.]|nr:V-type ATPase 116kDa subunit family protein [Candidatus Caldarchaeum sp.]
MGLSEVVEVAVVAPRHRAEDVIKELFEFEEFHPAAKEHHRDPKLHEMEHRTEAGLVRLQSVIQELGVKDSVGILEMLVKPDRVVQRDISAEGLAQLLDRLDNESAPLLQEINRVLEERKNISERLEWLGSLYRMLKKVEEVELDLESLKKFKRFHVFLGFGSGSELAELKRALPTSVVVETLVEGMALILVVSRRSDAETVERVLKGLGVKPLQIPPEYPQTLREAVKVVGDEVSSMEKKAEEADAWLRDFVEKRSEQLVALRDGYMIVKEGLNRIGGAGGLKFFAVFEGYIPAERAEEFRETVGRKYPVLLRSEAAHSSDDDSPSSIKNPSLVKPFEKITMIQGMPSHGEIDPTPFVSVFFSVFYGVMFADLGQGLIILLFGLFMLRRVSGDLREWAKLLVYLGLSSAITGFLIGEAFGFKVAESIGSPQILHLVEKHGETKTFNIAEVQRLLVFTIMLGVVHLMLGYVLSIVKFLKENEKVEALAVKLPTLLMYVFGIFFALAFFGAGGSIQNILNVQTPVPLLNIPTNVAGAIGVYGSVACILVLMLGRFAAGLAGLGHKVSIVSSVGQGLLEVLENIIHFLSNTISYSRLTILLIVHTALMLLLNTAWEALGLVTLPLLIVGNVGIILLEGMLVFIQAMRLHVYEFFSKFFEGAGQPFRKLAKETLFVKVSLGRGG